jgi:hypothetical protein
MNPYAAGGRSEHLARSPRKTLAVLGALAVAYVFMTNLYIPGK